jgi:N-acyl-phosphatidylethanolamine-hydrolysing phospholipase D
MRTTLFWMTSNLNMRILTLVLIITWLSGCAPANQHYDKSKAHHTPDGFQNHYASNQQIDRSLWEVLSWQIDSWWNSLPPKPNRPTPQVKADIYFVQKNGKAGVNMQPALTWIGHASMLVQASGINVLTDPIFSERASPVQFAGPKRSYAPGLALKDLPHIDVVVISHNHYDHLDENSVKQLAQQAGGSPMFLVPLGVKAWFDKLGLKQVKELDWWQVHRQQGVDFHFTPVQHWSARGVGDRRQSLWGGWAVMGTDFQWYYSGDTGYSADFADTRKRLAPLQTEAMGGGFDVALIAIGAYEPRWFMRSQHVNPAEALQIHQDLNAKRSIGVHWGTFNLTDEPLDQAPIDLENAKNQAKVPSDAFSVMAIGETRLLARRLQPAVAMK